MGAIASQYQTDPWEPNVDKSSKDASDQEKAAAAYTKVYGGTPTYGPDPSGSPGPMVNAPELAMAWTTAPDLVPTTPTPTPSYGSGPLPPSGDLNAFSIDLGTLRSTEQSFLNAIQTAMSSYQNLRTTVENAISSPSLFGQDVGSWEKAHGWTYGSLNWSPDDLDAESTSFAESINPLMAQSLQDVAGVLESCGMFAAMINNSGQLYTEGDATSAFPAGDQEITAAIWNVIMNPPPQNNGN